MWNIYIYIHTYKQNYAFNFKKLTQYIDRSSKNKSTVTISLPILLNLAGVGGRKKGCIYIYNTERMTEHYIQ